MARSFNYNQQQYLQGSTPVSVTPFSVACWFYSDEAAHQTLLSISDGGNNTFYVRFRSNGALRAYANGELAETSSTFSLNEWHHALAVFASSTSRAIYGDGGSKGTDTDPVTPSGINIVRIGRAAGGEYFSGGLAEVGVWNVALTDVEVAFLATGVSPLSVRSGNLVGYWPLLGPTATGDNDFSTQNRFHLTAYNSPTWTTHPPNVKDALMWPWRDGVTSWMNPFWGEEAAGRIPRYGFTNFQIPGIV